MLIWHPCNPNKSQDSMYGDNVRVCNQTSKQGTFRCSVCDKEVSASGNMTSKIEAKRSDKKK